MRCRTRTCAGAGITAVAVAAALALSGCSSGSGSNGAKQPTTGVAPSGQQSTPAATQSGVAAGTATTTATGNPSRSVEGVWLAMQGSTKVQLVLGKGRAGLTSTHLCGGSYTGQDGIGLVLTCMDGDKERTSGHGVLGPDGKTLTVRWTGGPTDTFSRTGLPSS